MTERTRQLKVYWSLQVGRALAAIMVVLFHCDHIFALPKYWNHSWGYLFNCGQHGVEFFFVLSGVVILHAHWKDLGRPSQVGSYAWKRFRRIYPIYWIMLLATLPAFYLVPGFGFGHETHPNVIIESFLLIHVTTIQTILEIAWTLFHEVMFYCVFVLMLLNVRIGTLMLSFWMLGSLFTLASPLPPGVLREYLSPFHLLFVFGMCIVLIIRRYKFPGLPLAIVGSAAFVALCVFDNVAGASPFPRTYALVYVAHGVAAAVAVLGYMFLEQEGRLSFHKFWKLLGDASYSIYLIHVPVLSLTAKAFYRLSRNLYLPLPIAFAVMSILAITSGIVLHLAIEKPLLRMLSSGSRIPADASK